SADDDLRRARFIIAGLAAEAITGLDKPGSSLDELVLSQEIGLNAAVKLDDERMTHVEYSAYAQRLWHEHGWGRALAILRPNHEAFERLAGELHQHEHLHGGKLRRLLAHVQRIAP